MLKYFLPLLGLTLLGNTTAQAQSKACDCAALQAQLTRLKAENALLRQSQGKGSATLPAAPARALPPQTQTGEDITYTLVSCTGDRKAQTVAVRFLVTNTGATRDLQFVKLVAIDASGEQHSTYDVGFGNTPRSSVPTGVPVKAAGILKGVLPSVTSFSLITLSSYHKNVGPGKDVELTYREVPITWK
ncbi:MAG: hypothetical protein ACRYG7_49905 [Janthinobacterium lividum]